MDALAKTAALIKKEEGLRLKVYPDSKNIFTIGYGRNLESTGISLQEAEYLFQNDLNNAYLAVINNLPWTKQLDEVRLSVIVSMCFQMGIGGLLNFVMTLPLVKAKRYKEAANQMLKSKWAKEDSPFRAARAAAMMETGEWIK